MLTDTLVAWTILALLFVVPLAVGPSGRARQAAALRRRDGGR